MFKKIDTYLIRSFIAPFAVSFGIAMFVLVMQFLWVYIDDIIGKGLGIFEIVELIFYLSLTVVPMGLPIGVLIASVMVLGNLAERYELSSFKSAGVSLLRVMRPLVVVVSSIVLFSIFCSEVLIPWANLQFYSRFYDIRRSKPTVTFEEGVFNDEFNDYTIRIGKKDADGRHIHQVLIYGNKGGNVNLINQTRAKSGEMFNTPDKQFIVMKLYDGIQYQETSNSNANKVYPFVRVKFKSWQKAFDLTQFERVQTDQDAFKNHQKMLGSRDLMRSVDSIGKQAERRKNDYKNEILMYYAATRPLVQSNTPPTTVAPATQPNTPPLDLKTPSNVPPPSVTAQSLTATATPIYRAKPTKKFAQNFYDTQRDTTIEGYRSILAEATANAEHLKSSAEAAISSLRDIRRAQENFLYELYMKYANAIVCLIFLFIGAPMGAIIQKGGFGYPILVAIGFFMFYMIATIYFRNAFKSPNSISAIVAASMPCFVIFPFAIYLTWRSVNDYKLDKITLPDWLTNFILFIKKKFAKKQPASNPT